MKKYFKGLGIIFNNLFGKKDKICDPYEEHMKIKDSGGMYLDGPALRTILKEKLGTKLSNSAYFYFLDSDYYLPSKQYVQDIIKIDSVDARRYRSQAFDCDDFAYMLNTTFIDITYKDNIRRAPFSFGIIFGYLPTPHAINIFVDDEKNVYLIEPQTDGFIDIESDKIKTIFSLVM